MKRLLTSTAFSIPLAFASIAYAQTTPPPATETPPAQTTTPGAGAPGTTGAPGTPGTAGGTAGTPGTPGAPGAGTMGATPSGAADATLMDPDGGEAKETIPGISVKNTLIGKSVHNENDEKVGDVTDVVIDRDGQATHMVVGAGGFLGMGQHDVAIPFDEIQRGDDRLTLSGYTKDQLKELPKVEVTE